MPVTRAPGPDGRSVDEQVLEETIDRWLTRTRGGTVGSPVLSETEAQDLAAMFSRRYLVLPPGTIPPGVTSRDAARLVLSRVSPERRTGLAARLVSSTGSPPAPDESSSR